MFSKKGEKESFIDWAHREIKRLSEKVETLEKQLQKLEGAYNDHTHAIKSSETRIVSYSGRTER